MTPQAERNKQLRIAAGQGNVDAVVQLLRRGASPLAYSPKHGMTSLHIATVGLHTDIVRNILRSYPGACTCRDKKIGATALHIAVERQKDTATTTSHVTTTIQAQQRQEQQEQQQQPSFATTLQIVDMFVQTDPRVVHMTRRDNGSTALHLACWQGNTVLAIKLLEAGSNIHARRFDGVTPLWLASCHGHWRTAKILLDHAALEETSTTAITECRRLHRANFQGKTPLYAAVANTTREHQMTASYLIQHICRNTVPTTNAFDPVTLLWQRTNPEHNAWAPIHVACREGNTPVVRALLECLPQHQRVNSNTETNNNYNRDHYHNNQQNLVNVRDALGWTPLMLACCNGWVPIVQLLLHWGARLDVTNEQGQTAIHLAVEFLDVLYVLLRYHEGLAILKSTSI